jgi:aryl-alcohol dehydrogenase-like predicted oxidoreductase
VNRKDTLSGKYLMQAVDGSLRRFGLEHIDLLYCHRPDPHPPLEETVRAMSDLITQGKALYWGTSEWSAADIHRAWELAEKHRLHKPVVEQPQYHLFHRQRVEQEYAALNEDIGLGLTTWSPRASGLLTGKYAQGIPQGSRARMKSMAFLREGLTHPDKNPAVAQLALLAAELDGNVAQLAIAWAAHNPRVSSVITGASNPAQLQANLGALAFLERLTPDVLQRMDALTLPLVQ